MPPLTKDERRALRLLARGGARYGTMQNAMRGLRIRGLAFVHDKGREGPGRYTWRPTPQGLSLARELETAR
jgi:hypothetical protein